MVADGRIYLASAAALSGLGGFRARPFGMTSFYSKNPAEYSTAGNPKAQSPKPKSQGALRQFRASSAWFGAWGLGLGIWDLGFGICYCYCTAQILSSVFSYG